MGNQPIVFGLSVKVKLPSVFPPAWMASIPNGLSWATYIKSADNAFVTVSSDPLNGQEQGWPETQTHPYYFVTVEEFPSYYFMVDWLTSLASGKIPCDCSMSTIMTSGCNNKNHT